MGLLLDYKFNNGAFAYWQSLDIGVICSAVVLSLRLILLQRRIKKYEEKVESGVSCSLFCILNVFV
mgnify:CR=1 FL=1